MLIRKTFLLFHLAFLMQEIVLKSSISERIYTGFKIHRPFFRCN